MITLLALNNPAALRCNYKLTFFILTNFSTYLAIWRNGKFTWAPMLACFS